MMASANIHDLPIASRDVMRDFLRDVVGDDIHLVAMLPDDDKHPRGRWFGNDAEAAASWAIGQNAGGRNTYWTVNRTKRGLDKKPAKTDITSARFAHADVDPPKDGSAWDRDAKLEELMAFDPPPSFIMNSGGGYGAFWRLEYDAENWPAIERINQSLEDELGGDHCWNIDRLMRVPGSVRYPNAAKRARGRSVSLACVVMADTGEIIDPETLRSLLPPPQPRKEVQRERVAIEGVALTTPASLGITGLNRLLAMIERPSKSDRSDDTWAVACEMVRQDFTDAQIAGILLNPDLAISASPLDKPSPTREVSRAISGARDEVGKPEPAIAGETAPKRLPEIAVEAGALHTMASEAEAALIAADAPFYVRGGLVRPIVDEMPAAHGRMTKVARLAGVDADTLLDYLSRHAKWAKFNMRQKAYVPTDPPAPVAKTILSRDGEWRFRKLAGVITTPTLRPDGTVFAEPGYDPSTQLLLLDPPAMPAIAAAPTKADAEAALSLLDALLDEFPFVDDASRSVALSALITPVVRGAMSVAPLHAITAPVAGSGKSFVIDIASVITSGQRAPVIAAGRTEEETEKRLGAALLSGQPIVSIDNVNGPLGGDMLCQMIERPVVKVRPLGVSKLVTIESRATTYATGNNIHLVVDMTRRVVLCSLDPNAERPELRQFKTDPIADILADRGRYIAAALTVVRAYACAGFPNVRPALASFEDWSRLVRSALVWLGRADPMDTMEKARAEDPVLDALRALLVMGI